MVHVRWDNVNQCFRIGRSPRTHFVHTFLSLEGWTLKAKSLTWLFLLMLPPIKAFQSCAAHTDGFGCKRLPPDREELHSAPVQTVTSAIDHLRGSASAILRSYLSSDRTRHRRLSDIFIDIKTMNTNTSALDTWSRDTIKAFLLDFFFLATKQPGLSQKRHLVTKISTHCA